MIAPMTNHYWRASSFPIARGGGVVVTSGYVYRSLGLHMLSSARPPRWSLARLGSGHRLISGVVADAFPIATEIAECGDWDFDVRSASRSRLRHPITRWRVR
jgi:hypothetical protein